jgi:hypothetical protein
LLYLTDNRLIKRGSYDESNKTFHLFAIGDRLVNWLRPDKLNPQ